MTKAELIAIVKLVDASWPTDVDQQSTYESWWRYLEDLDYELVLKIVDELVIEAAPWRPKVGEIRRRTIDGPSGWPSPDAAWVLAEACMIAANHGIDTPGLPDGVAVPLGECIRAARTNRAAFLELWKAKTAERYAILKRS
mgnify:CR=1 FL=1